MSGKWELTGETTGRRQSYVTSREIMISPSFMQNFKK